MGDLFGSAAVRDFNICGVDRVCCPFHLHTDTVDRQRRCPIKSMYLLIEGSQLSERPDWTIEVTNGSIYVVIWALQVNLTYIQSYRTRHAYIPTYVVWSSSHSNSHTLIVSATRFLGALNHRCSRLEYFYFGYMPAMLYRTLYTYETANHGLHRPAWHDYLS